MSPLVGNDSSGPQLKRGLASTSLISILLGPFAGYLWIGRGRLAVITLIAGLALLAVYVCRLHAGDVWVDVITLLAIDPVWSWLAGGLLSLLLVLPFRMSSDARRWYARRWGFLACILGSVLIAMLVALVVRSFLIQSFSIPSSSMEPTLQPGDYIFVDKRSYGYGPYSLPFGPWGGGYNRQSPKRGDIAIFRHPGDPRIDYVKRVIGVGGDTIQMIDGQVVLNGAPLSLEPVNAPVAAAPSAEDVHYLRETLPDGRHYVIQNIVDGGFGDNTAALVVPEGHVFVMGDNRDNSNDSRYTMGSVPLANLVGRADVIFWNDQDRPFRDRRDLTP